MIQVLPGGQLPNFLFSNNDVLAIGDFAQNLALVNTKKALLLNEYMVVGHAVLLCIL